MALVKKGSRKITVDGTAYRWRITRTYKSADDILEVFIERIENGNTVLCVRTGFLRPDGAFSNIGESTQGIVTPKNVESYIKQALAKGWKPESKESMFELSLKE